MGPRRGECAARGRHVCFALMLLVLAAPGTGRAERPALPGCVPASPMAGTGGLRIRQGLPSAPLAIRRLRDGLLLPFYTCGHRPPAATRFGRGWRVLGPVRRS